jgi:hypothetical protein
LVDHLSMNKEDILKTIEEYWESWWVQVSSLCLFFSRDSETS